MKTTILTLSALCIGVTVIHGIHIGRNTVVGAGSTVLHDLPDGVVAYGLPAKAIREQWEYAQEKFSAIPGAKFKDDEFYKFPLTPDQFDKVHKPEMGIPSLEMFSIGARSPFNPTPGNGHIWFSPIIPRTGEAVLEANKVFAQAAKDFGLPLLSFSLPTTYWMRAFIFLFGFPITHDVATNKKNRENFKQIVRVAAEHGWGEYRTAPRFRTR